MSVIVENEEALIERLRGSVLWVTFTKTDGNTRVMRCTLRPDLLPPLDPEAKAKPEKKKTPGVIPVFDLEANDWRSFRFGSIIKVSEDAEKKKETIRPQGTDEPATEFRGGSLRFGDVSVQTPFWGYHLALDCGGCDKDDVRSAANIAQFSEELVRCIRMKAFGPPQVVHFAGHNPTVAGHTLTQLIETSLVSGHFVDSTGDCYIDVFSCAAFDIDAAIRCVRDFFNPRTINRHILLRQA